MANNAANLVGAKLLFGSMSGSTFTADANSQIIGDTSGDIRIATNTVTITGAVVMNKALTVTNAITANGGISGNLAGNATTATKLANVRTLSVTGDLVGTASFDGSANAALPTTVTKIRGVSATLGTTNPTGSTRLNIEGHLYATRVYNSVWNDIADFIEVEKDTPIQYGRVYIKDAQGHKIANAYAQKGSLGIASDTLGFGVGQKENVPQIPIAIGGFVLAYTDEEYESGIPLVSHHTGCLTKARLFTRIFHPERILATYYKPELNVNWNGISVDHRHWVKVK